MTKVLPGHASGADIEACERSPPASAPIGSTSTCCTGADGPLEETLEAFADLRTPGRSGTGE